MRRGVERPKQTARVAGDVYRVYSNFILTLRFDGGKEENRALLRESEVLNDS